MKSSQRTFVLLVAVLMVAACAASSQAQGRRGGQGGQPPGAPRGRGGFGAGGFGGGMMGGGNNTLMLLTRRDVRDHLDLLDDQISDLEALRDTTDMRGIMQGLRDVPAEQRQQRMREAMQETQKKMEAKVNEILVPLQAKRLKELSIQFAMRRGGVTSGPVADELGISETQAGQLREKARKMQQEFQQKLQQELVKELTPDQQARLQQLQGEPFEFDETIPQPRRGAPAAGRRGRGGGGRRGRTGD